MNMDLETFTMPRRIGKHGGVDSVWSGQQARSDDEYFTASRQI